MSRVVQKFGGTSVGDVDRIHHVAQLVKQEYDQGNEVAVVVSAMAGDTNKLVNLVRDTAVLHDTREYDVVVAAGEQITTGLVALALQKIGIPARSWLGWQLPVQTDSAHGKARILNIQTHELDIRLQERQVAVIAGFQGMDSNNRVTTLGRGGSDTSAVAIAAALKADRCDIYTDVEGVYTADPRIVKKARLIDKITYEEMLELASQGAKVLQTRAVEMAMNHRTPLRVLSSFNPGEGTLVVDESQILERKVISGIAYDREEARITLTSLPDQPGIAASIFRPLADMNIKVDMIVQNAADERGLTDLTFTVTKADFERSLELIKAQQPDLGYRALLSDQDVVKISVVGVGMKSQSGIAQTMFQTLADRGINIQVISTSEIKISVLIPMEYTELAVRALHTAYGLDT